MLLLFMLLLVLKTVYLPESTRQERFVNKAWILNENNYLVVTSQTRFVAVFGCNN